MNLRNGLVAGLILNLGVIGALEPLWAAPDGSQRLRGMGDRVFLVIAEITAAPDYLQFLIGTKFPNCYIFESEPDNEGYNWFESGFPDVKGVWAQDSNGAKTTYFVESNNVIFNDAITQSGQVTPARGKGNLQLIAISTLDFGPEPDGVVELEFLSVGEEIDASEAETACPVPEPPE